MKSQAVDCWVSMSKIDRLEHPGKWVDLGFIERERFGPRPR